MYHAIGDLAEGETRGYYRMSTQPHRFVEHLDVLSENGFIGLNLTEGLRWLSGEIDLPDRKSGVVLTFDDGFADFRHHAWPQIKALGFSATMYLATAYVGDTPKTFKGRTCLTWAEVNALRTDGVEFGAHTVNHPRLAEIPPAEMREELSFSKTTIEERTGTPVKHFAHPYAFPSADRSYLASYFDALDHAGFETAVTTEIRTASESDPTNRIPRIPVNGCDDPMLFRAKVFGGYDWLNLPQRIAKRRRRRVEIDDKNSPAKTPETEAGRVYENYSDFYGGSRIVSR